MNCFGQGTQLPSVKNNGRIPVSAPPLSLSIPLDIVESLTFTFHQRCDEPTFHVRWLKACRALSIRLVGWFQGF